MQLFNILYSLFTIVYFVRTLIFTSPRDPIWVKGALKVLAIIIINMPSLKQERSFIHSDQQLASCLKTPKRTSIIRVLSFFFKSHFKSLLQPILKSMHFCCNTRGCDWVSFGEKTRVFCTVSQGDWVSFENMVNSLYGNTHYKHECA